MQASRKVLPASAQKRRRLRETELNHLHRSTSTVTRSGGHSLGCRVQNPTVPSRGLRYYYLKLLGDRSLLRCCQPREILNSKNPTTIIRFPTKLGQLAQQTCAHLSCTSRYRNSYRSCPRKKDLAKGSWRLQLLSDRPLIPPPVLPTSVPPAEGIGGAGGEGEAASVLRAVPCGVRSVYGGVYAPNKYFVLFRSA